MIKSPINIVIADDNRFFCDALKDSLNFHEELNVIQTFNNLDHLISFTSLNKFDVLILDVNFNGKSSLDFLNEIKKNNNFKIIALTTMNNNYIKNKAISNGVDFFVGKDEDLENFKEVILTCFMSKTVKKNKSSFKVEIDNYKFTKRKLEILQALYDYSNKKEKELSAILNITESSLKSHKRELFEITLTKSTPELIKFGIQKGIIIT
ncbi:MULTISPECIES: response regulator transcription factor [Polaribacter]|uniref:Response regulator transcription factor n=1 Tax=Polaribacter marinaquae TaxID=1642819 RepID=A0ABZ2TS62_9FLAO